MSCPRNAEAVKGVGLEMEIFQEGKSGCESKWLGAEKRQRQIIHSETAAISRLK